MTNNIALPSGIKTKAGKTFLSIKEDGGNLIIVDQDGFMVNGLISCSSISSIDSVTELKLTAVAYKQ